MGRKKKRNRPIIFCYYCDRNFDTERVLIQHQRAKHFKCPTCHKKISSARGMMIHVFQIHKETIETVPGGKEGRDSFDTEILGMEGVPTEMVEAKRIEMFGEPSSKKQKIELGHPYLTHPLLVEGAVPPNQIIIPGTTPSVVNQQLGAMHPSRAMMMASAGGMGQTGLPMFGVPGFPAGVPLPLVLPPAPPPKPWPPVQPPPGAPGQPKMATAVPPTGGRPLVMGKVGKPALDLPPPPAAAQPPVPVAPVPPPPVAAPTPAAPDPVVPVPSLPPPVPAAAAPPVTGLPAPGLPPAPGSTPAAEPPKSEAAATPTTPSAALPLPDPEEESPKKKKKSSVLIYEDRKFSQEEKRAMHPKYSAFLNRRIATLSNSIEERLRSLR